MKKIIYLLILILSVTTVFAFNYGWNNDNIILQNVFQQTKTVNNTFFDASKSFALLDFANSCSIISSSNVSSLSCSSGNPSFLRFNNSTNNWSLSCCDYITSKCHWYNTTDMFNFTENKEFADNVLNMKYDEGFGVMCCNSQMKQCFKKLNNLDCDKEYDQIIVSMSFNVSTGNWSVTSCLDGFK